MKRKIGLVILSLVVLTVLTACQQQTKLEGLEVAGVGQPNYQSQATTTISPVLTTPTQTTEPKVTDWDKEAAPGDEEDTGLAALSGDQETQWPYAGATPMPLDPIDMPTPTPRPNLTFAFQTYDVTRLGISFEAPIGWEQDDSVDSTIILRQPESDVMDNYRATLSIEVRSTGSTLSKSEMREQVADIFKTLSGNYVSWESKVAAERTLLGADGIYNDYRGVMSDGTIVRGRVQVTSVSNRTITVHLSCPGGFNEDYMSNVYTKLRATIKETK